VKPAAPAPNERFIVTLLLAAALGLTGAMAVQRLEIEAAAPQVELAYSEARLLKAAEQDPGAPAALLGAGVTTLVREPYTLDDMLRYGLAEAWQPEPDLLELRFADRTLSGNAVVFLSGQFALKELKVRLRQDQYIFDVRLPHPIPRIDPRRFILEIPSGPMPPGFRRALHLPAGDWGPALNLDQFNQAVASLQPEVVLPEWRGGWGARNFFRAYLYTPWLRKPAIALPEFSLPSAARAVLRSARLRVLFPAHILTAKEARRLRPAEQRQRMVRAVRERGVRFLYVQPPRGRPFAQDLAFFQALKNDLRREGIRLGPAGQQGLGRTGRLPRLGLFLGLGAALFLLLWRLALWAAGTTGQDEAVDHVLTIRLRPANFRWTAILTVLGLWIVQSEGPADWGVKLAAWLLAVTAPLLGLTSVASYPEVFPAPGRALRAGLLDFCRVTAWSLAGGLAIAVLLYQPQFTLRLDTFAGVKLAYLLPLAVSGVVLFPQVLEGQWWRERWQPGRRWATLAGGLAVLGLFALLLLRTGNFSWFKASRPELALRDALETLLGVRPRFKEFLLGHPLLLLGLVGRRLPAVPTRIWPQIAVFFGMIGQVSLINTFCHIHTPLMLSLLRTFHGLWLGLLLGILAWGVWRLARRRRTA